MPIYTYKCRDCGTVFDFLMIKQSEKPQCEKCGSENLEKQLSAPGAVIMGTSHPKGTTCCGRNERCDTPPCTDDGICKR
jgi:putative FmdB family regulatory protein